MTMDRDDHLRRAQLLFEQRRYDIALTEALAVLAQEEGHLGASVIAALAKAELGDTDGALEQAQATVARNPESPLAHSTLAQVWLHCGEKARASTTIQRAIALAPENADLHATSARIFYGLGRLGSALAAAERGMALAPDHPTCLNVRALALLRQGKTTGALRTSERLLAEFPENAHAHLATALAKLGRRDHGAAIEHFTAALRLEPQLDVARTGLRHALRCRSRWFRISAAANDLAKDRGVRIALTVALAACLFGPDSLWNGSPTADRIVTWIALVMTPLLLLLAAALPVANLALLRHPAGRGTLSRRAAMASRIATLTIAGSGAWWTIDVVRGLAPFDGSPWFWPTFVASQVAATIVRRMDS